jgi:hypothetical protein
MFGWLTEKKVTYRAKIVRAQGKTPLASYLGVKMYKTPEGEFMTGIDTSVFESLKDAKDFVKSVKQPNPAKLKKGVRGTVKLVGRGRNQRLLIFT